MPSGTETTSTHSFYTWQSPSKSISFRINFDVVDCILLEVMKGFGAVPRRGAEVGGLLLGSIQKENDQTIVHIEEYEPIPCEHAQGPSFSLSSKDLVQLREMINRRREAPAGGSRIVGYFRSHTREGLYLCPEDLDFIEEHLPEPDLVALVIKPYATRVSSAGIFLREDNDFRADAPDGEFPFRRKELGGGTSSLDRTAAAARFGQSRREVGSAGDPLNVPAPRGAAEDDVPHEAIPAVSPTNVRSGWVWIPLSFIFMLLGIVLGFQVAINARSRTPSNSYVEGWNLALGVQRDSNRLVISWDRGAPAVRDTPRGVMTIIADSETRRIDLSATDLQAGQLIYRSAPQSASVRLEVFPRDRISIAESVELNQSR